MKALSLKQPWAGMVLIGDKTIETRKWKTSFRGDIIICSSMLVDKVKFAELKQQIDINDLPPEFFQLGKALGIVNLFGIEPMTKNHEDGAMCKVYPGAWAWWLRNIRQFRYPHHIKGQLGLFELDIHDNDYIKINGHATK